MTSALSSASALAALSLPAATNRAAAQGAGEASQTQASPPGKTPAGTAYQILDVKPGEAHLRGTDKKPVAILGYNGTFPGPVLRCKRGDELAIRLVNRLEAPTSLHLRGLRVPNALDGYAPLTGPAIAPGESSDFVFRTQESGTYYLHPMTYAHAAEQAGRGLGAIVIAEEEAPPETDLDLPFVIADWRLNEAGALAEPVIDPAESATAGRLGGLMTVNGIATPLKHEVVPNGRVRLRLVNMAMAQIAALTFEGVVPYVAAIDSQPCDPFEPVRHTIPVNPGARFEVFFDMPAAAGERAKIILRRWPIRGRALAEPQEIALFTAQGRPRTPLPKLTSLPLNPGLPPIIPLQNAKRLDLVIAPAGTPADPRKLWTMNGRSLGPDSEPLFSVKRGTPVTLGFINRSEVPHVMRVHGHVMRQLHLLDDGWEPYWRDGLIVQEERTVRVAFLADNPGRWRIGSGILAHGEAGLSGWFEVN